MGVSISVHHISKSSFQCERERGGFYVGSDAPGKVCLV